MNNPLNPDLEKPYQDACKRDDEYAELEDKVREDFLSCLAKFDVCENFIECWIDDPAKELSDILKLYSQFRDNNELLRLKLSAFIEGMIAPAVEMKTESEWEQR